MALTEELPIYRATYRLLNLLIRATQDFPRFYKYSLGTRMVDVCLDMAMFALEMEKIGKQATGWKQYNEKGKAKQINLIHLSNL